MLMFSNNRFLSVSSSTLPLLSSACKVIRTEPAAGLLLSIQMQMALYQSKRKLKIKYCINQPSAWGLERVFESFYVGWCCQLTYSVFVFLFFLGKPFKIQLSLRSSRKPVFLTRDAFLISLIYEVSEDEFRIHLYYRYHIYTIQDVLFEAQMCVNL